MPTLASKKNNIAEDGSLLYSPEHGSHLRIQQLVVFVVECRTPTVVEIRQLQFLK